MCNKLSNAGKDVRCFYWNVPALIKEFGSNLLSVVTAILYNSEAAEAYGYLHDKYLVKSFQILMNSFIVNGKPEFHQNQIVGIDEINWPVYDADKRNVLHVADKSIKVETNVMEDDKDIEKMIEGS